MSIRHPPHDFPHATTLFGATFFILTGFHGMHVTGGVIYLSMSTHPRYDAVPIRPNTPIQLRSPDFTGISWTSSGF